MFLHNFKYAMKTAFKNKTNIIWTLVFPIALATFMHMAFGNLYEKDQMFKEVPVAVVEEKQNDTFKKIITELSDGDNSILDAQYMSSQDAEDKLKNNKINGIIYVNDDISLVLNDNSFENTVLKQVVSTYKKSEKIITDIALKNPAALDEAIDNIMGETQYFTLKSTSDGNQDVNTNYFYAVFAMSCLFSSFAAVEKITKLQANTSALGMRRCVSPENKVLTIISEYCSMFAVQFAIEVITLVYIVFIGVDLGGKYLHILIVLFFGSAIGLSLGSIIGAISKLSLNIKSGICVVISMVLSVMSDLVSLGIKDMIEHNIPIINRINPAALIVDSLYALNIYDTYDRYIQNIAVLGIMSVILLSASFLILRRNKYASL